MIQIAGRHVIRAVVFACGLLAAGCATARTSPSVKVDLAPAREAVEAARQAGAPERAPEAFAQAQGHLNEAEALASAGEGEKMRQAEVLSRLTIIEARCAIALAQLGQQQSAAATSVSQEVEKLTARLRKAEEDQRKAEDRAASFQRDLEYAETEVIRTKARLKGIETKAEASSAIAEARILIRRLGDEKGAAGDVARGQQALARAEELLKQDNYGAAIFFAQKVQDIAMKAREAPGPTRPATGAAVEKPAPQKSYRVRAASVNIRRGPSTAEVVVGKAPMGAVFAASVVRGDWVKVTLGKVEGWVHRSVLE